MPAMETLSSVVYVDDAVYINAVYVDDECKAAWKRLREKCRREKDKLNSSRSGDAARHEKHDTCSQLWAS